jgi:ferredoxin/flavodoxin
MAVTAKGNKAKPKGVICYYSGSGNTKLACQYIVSNIKSIDFDLFNIVREGVPDFEAYKIAGFATFTDFLGPSYLVQTFLQKLGQQNGKPAFVFNTYGAFNGRTLKTLDKWVSAKGFKVVAGHSLHTPESYPPMVARGRGNEQAPSEKEMNGFSRFISELEQVCSLLKEGKEIRRKRTSIGLLNSILPTFRRTKARDDMGEKYVDAELCNECGVCEKLCPCEAVKLDPKPVFDMNKCYGCWSCYNHCPTKAIYTQKFRGVGHYPKPIKQLKKKLKV